MNNLWTFRDSVRVFSTMLRQAISAGAGQSFDPLLQFDISV
jgi:hypothetical protein